MFVRKKIVNVFAADDINGCHYSFMMVAQPSSKSQVNL